MPNSQSSLSPREKTCKDGCFHLSRVHKQYQKWLDSSKQSTSYTHKPVEFAGSWYNTMVKILDRGKNVHNDTKRNMLSFRNIQSPTQRQSKVNSVNHRVHEMNRDAVNQVRAHLNGEEYSNFFNTNPKEFGSYLKDNNDHAARVAREIINDPELRKLPDPLVFLRHGLGNEDETVEPCTAFESLYNHFGDARNKSDYSAKIQEFGSDMSGCDPLKCIWWMLDPSVTTSHFIHELHHLCRLMGRHISHGKLIKLLLNDHLKFYGYILAAILKFRPVKLVTSLLSGGMSGGLNLISRACDRVKECEDRDNKLRQDQLRYRYAKDKRRSDRRQSLIDEAPEKVDPCPKLSDCNLADTLSMSREFESNFSSEFDDENVLSDDDDFMSGDWAAPFMTQSRASSSAPVETQKMSDPLMDEFLDLFDKQHQ
jgi:hypothetical protein